jgi:hypothetical protein
MVTVELPEVPEAMVGLVAVKRKLWFPTTRVAVEAAYVESPE